MSDDDQAAFLQQKAEEELMKQKEMQAIADKMINMPEGDATKM